MKSIKEHQKAFLDYYKRIVKEYDSLFKIRVRMLEKSVCPNCGIPARHWSSNDGFSCHECEFHLTEGEFEKVTYDYDDRISEKMKKSILKRKLKRCKVKSMENKND